jgi:integrase
MQEKGNKPRSIKNTIDRLRRLLPLDRPLSSFSEKEAQRCYEERTRVVAVDTHRSELAEEKTFFKFAVQQKWLPTNPIENVNPVGRRSRGKPQLHGAEAQRFSDRALAFFRSGERGWEAALGNLLVLWLGLRTGEVLSLEVRDVDPMPEGMWLWVAETDGKTDAAKRRLEVPEEIAELLEVQVDHALAKGSSWLFPAETSSGRRSHTWLRRAAQKICDEAGVKYVPPHGLRGTQSTLALEAGASAHLVAQQLGHTSFKVTERHYLAPGAKERAQSQRALRVLAGGKK